MLGRQVVKYGARYAGGVVFGLAAGFGIINYASVVNAEELQIAEGNVEGTFQKPNWKQKIFGNYENRMREMSAPEKVFEYFASIQKEGDEWFMTPADFVRSITPFNFSGQAQVGLSHNLVQKDVHAEAIDRVMKVADPDGDGLISFQEYIFFTTLLSIPEKFFEIAFKMIDENGDGVVDQGEFFKVIKIIRSHNPVAQATRQAQGWTPNKTEEDVLSIPAWFGEDGKETLTYDQFYDFLSGLHEGVSELHFKALDYNDDGQISARDFVMSLVGFGNLKDLPGYVERVDELGTSALTVGLDEFQDWQKVLKKINEIDHALALFLASEGKFTIKQLQRSAKAVAGVDLKDETLKVVLTVFDEDGDGTLDTEEFMDVLRAASDKGINRPRDFGVTRFIKCVSTCSAKN